MDTWTGWGVYAWVRGNNINVILNLFQNPTGQLAALLIHLADGVLK
jgi:hypothetical protein